MYITLCVSAPLGEIFFTQRHNGAKDRDLTSTFMLHMKKSKRLFIPVFLFLFSFYTKAQDSVWRVVSPDKSLALELVNDHGKLFYKVISGKDIIIKPSSLGIERDDENFTENLSPTEKAASMIISDHYSLKIGKHKENDLIANQLTVRLKNGNNAFINIDLRAYNDGLAFRYRFDGVPKKITVKKEKTEFVIPEGKKWLQNYSMPAQWNPSYEENYMNGIDVGTTARDISGWAFPALFHTNNHWLLITEANAVSEYCGTHLDQHCENGIYKIAFPLQGEANGIGSIYPVSEIPFATPWHVIITGRDLGTIVESNIVYNLSEGNKIGDDSWVKPGRSSWSWWSDHPSSRDFQKLKKYVDLAKDMQWEYSLVDANWNIMKGGDIDELAKYASSKNIGLSLWYNSGGPQNTITEQPRNIMNDPEKRKAEFAKLHKMGIKAVKVDFFNSDKQIIMQLYRNILEDAAKEKIMVIFHGCTLPRGWSRTYPNLLSMEGVRGAEQLGWDSAFANNAAQHNTILAFTRNVVGPMDYTPVTFSDYACCPHSTTNTHELALSVIFESGMLHFADSDSSYRSQSDAVKKFMRKVPNTWDETRFLKGEPGKEIILARRSGSTWYIAGINGESVEKNFSFDLAFLSPGTYKATVFTDDKDPRKIDPVDSEYIANSRVGVRVYGKGGMLMVLEPK